MSTRATRASKAGDGGAGGGQRRRRGLAGHKFRERDGGNSKKILNAPARVRPREEVRSGGGGEGGYWALLPRVRKGGGGLLGRKRGEEEGTAG